MNEETYSKARNNLIGLLQGAASIPDAVLNLTQKDELNAIVRKLQENQFTFTLIAHFQGGKSTTFNALCDGREISPTGFGIKTSATVITAQHTLDEKEQNTATILWRTKEELLEIIEPILNFGKYKLGKNENLDLDNPEDRRKIEDELQRLWDEWRNSKAKFNQHTLDTLRIASLIVHFYADKKLNKLKETAIFDVNKIREVVHFPVKWETIWKSGTPTAFSFEEITFVFIREVNCKLNSPNLSKIGVKIIDCPGLFASNYDTKIANQKIHDADAVWYLLDGKEGIGESDTNAAKLCVTNKGIENVFFSINRKTGKEATMTFIENDADKLNSVGVDIRPEDIFPYQARLAFHSAMGAPLINGRLDDSTKIVVEEQLRRHLEKNGDIRELWKDIVLKDLDTLCFPSREKVTELNTESIAIAREASGLDKILDALSAHVIKNKAKTILIKNGSEKVLATLEEIQARAKQQLDDLTKNAEQLEKEYQAQKEKLKEIKKKYLPQLKDVLDDETVDESFMRDFFKDVLESNFSDFSSLVGWHAKKNYTWLPWWFFGKGDIQIMRDAVEHAIQNCWSPASALFLNKLQSGNNSTFQKRLQSPLAQIEANIKKEAESINSVTIKDAFKNLPTTLDAFEGIKFNVFNKIISELADNAMPSWWEIISAFVWSEDMDTRVAKALKKHLEENKGNLRHDVEFFLKKERIFSKVREGLKELYVKWFDDIVEDLQKDINARKQRLAQGHAQCELQAKEFDALCNEHIIPLREKVSDFETEVKEQLAAKTEAMPSSENE